MSAGTAMTAPATTDADARGHKTQPEFPEKVTMNHSFGRDTPQTLRVTEPKKPVARPSRQNRLENPPRS